MGKFSQQIEAFNRKAQARMRATAREAVQETVSMAQRVKEEGGTMPIVTGFLRASVRAAVGHMPSGPADNKSRRKYKVGEAMSAPAAAALLRWDPNKGETFFVGWTANYARHMEARYGFLRSAVELWDQTVYKAAKKVETGLD